MLRSIFRISRGLVLALVVGTAASAFDVPTSQSKLYQIVQASVDDYKAEVATGNALRLAALRTARANALCYANLDRGVQGWQAIVQSVTLNGDDVQLQVQVASNISLVGSVASDAAWTTQSLLKNLAVGNRLVVGGRFVTGDPDCFALVENGDLSELMQAPVFSFQFDSLEMVEQIGWEMSFPSLAHGSLACRFTVDRLDLQTGSRGRLGGGVAHFRGTALELDGFWNTIDAPVKSDLTYSKDGQVSGEIEVAGLYRSAEEPNPKSTRVRLGAGPGSIGETGNGTLKFDLFTGFEGELTFDACAPGQG